MTEIIVGIVGLAVTVVVGLSAHWSRQSSQQLTNPNSGSVRETVGRIDERTLAMDRRMTHVETECHQIKQSLADHMQVAESESRLLARIARQVEPEKE